MLGCSLLEQAFPNLREKGQNPRGKKAMSVKRGKIQAHNIGFSPPLAHTQAQIRPCLNLINCDVENKYVMEHIFSLNAIILASILRVVTDPTWFWQQHFLARQSSPVWMVASQAGKIFPAFRKKYFRPTGRKYLSASWFWTRLSAVTAVLWDQNLVFVFDILFVLKQQV